LKAVKKVAGNLTIGNCASLSGLDAFSQVDTITGNLLIDNTALTSIIAFSQLVHLGGELRIEDNKELLAIEGFEQTKTIGGIRIERNHKLGIISNFDQLDSLTGILDISDTEVSSLPTMPMLLKTNAEINLYDNSHLQKVPFLEHLEEIGGLQLTYGGLDTLRCPKLKHVLSGLDVHTTSLDAIEMDSLRYIGGNLVIRSTSVDQINMFRLLEYIGGSLYIVNNDQLTDVNGLQRLTHIGKKLVISDNADLLSLQGLQQVNPDSMHVSNSYVYNLVVTITNNRQLDECSFPPVCGVLNNPAKRTEIFGNKAGCNNEIEIATACESQYNCVPDSLILDTQAEIDAFPSFYPKCRDIQGTLIIRESEPGNIVHLDSLLQIQRIGKALIIQNNTVLADLSGLDSLTRIGGKLIIADNTSLTSLMALDQLLPNMPVQYTTADSAFRLNNNPALSECNIPFVCDVLTIPETTFGLQNNLQGCNTVSEIQLNCNYPVSCDFKEAYSQALIDEFPVRYPGCKHLLNGLKIDSYEGAILDLTPLSQLNSINGGLTVSFTHLQNLTGLENISSIYGRIFIDWNNSLQDISALNQVDPGTLRPSGKNKIFLNQNHSLSDCATELICKILQDAEEAVTLSLNSAGCNSAMEVLEQCIVGTISSSDPVRILIYPNPADDIIYLQSLHTLTEHVSAISIIDLQGRTWWSGPFAESIDVGELPTGLYGLILHTTQQGPVSFKVVLK
jgi:hypothetical protein